MPKSSSFTLPSLPTRMFDGLRSRWMTRCWCACCTASQTSRKSRSRRATRRRVRAAVLGERHALDVLHHEPRRAVGERVGVVEPRDGRMVELRERALLAGEALAPRRREPGVAQDLDRRDRPEVVALGEVDDAHPALAEHPRRCDRGRSAVAARPCAPDSPSTVPPRPPTPRSSSESPRASSASSASASSTSDGSSAHSRFEETRAFGPRELGRVVKQRLNAFPARGVHRVSDRSAPPRAQLVRRARPWPRASRAAPSTRRRRASSAVSATSRPPKKRLSTSCAWRGSRRARSSSASSSASRSSAPDAVLMRATRRTSRRRAPAAALVAERGGAPPRSAPGAWRARRSA